MNKILLGLVLASSLVMAESSKEYAMMGQSSWSAFKCSALASKFGDTKEQERLFIFAYKEGLEFINAVQLKKIKKLDLSSGVPLVMLLSLEGPTPDFILGRIYEVATEYALKDVYKTETEPYDEEMQQIRAGNKFREQNCKLLGF